MLQTHVTSETGRLRSVIIGYPDNFHLVEPPIINETQKKYYHSPERPLRQTIMQQLNGLKQALQAHDVQVFQPEPMLGIPDQLMTRDIGVVIDNTFIVTHMAEPSRQNEWRGIVRLLNQLQHTRILHVPDDIVLEGGDIIVDKGCIFVGISQRTTPDGAEFLAESFPHYQVVQVHLKQLAEGEDVLHLDCSFVPVGHNLALIYPGGIQHLPAEIRDTYQLIEVTQAEQQRLTTNVLSISPEIVISRPQSARVNDLMRQHGLTVLAVPYSEPPKTGGSFRCCSLPLWRD